MKHEEPAQISDEEGWVRVRLSLISALGPGFQEFGHFLWVGGYMIGGDRAARRSPFGYGGDAVVGLAIVGQTAGELCSGVAQWRKADHLPTRLREGGLIQPMATSTSRTEKKRNESL